MKKILTFGHSIVDPNFFNSRVLRLTDVEDDYHFTKILSKSTQIPNYKVYAIAGAGNNWISSSVINHLDDIDSETLVVINWSFVDRIDLLLGDNQEDLQHEIEGCLTENFDFLKFNKTVDLEGLEKSTGMRFWPTGHFMLVPKIAMKNIVNHVGQLKNFYENVALVQRLLTEKNAKHVHFLQLSSEHHYFRSLIRDFTNKCKKVGLDSPRYELLEFETFHHDLFEKYPELTAWHKTVDWKLFTDKTMFEFYQHNSVPYICVDLYNNFHQPPINHYMFIKNQILTKLKMPCADLLDEMKKVTAEHCKKYNSIYEWDDELISNILL